MIIYWGQIKYVSTHLRAMNSVHLICEIYLKNRSRRGPLMRFASTVALKKINLLGVNFVCFYWCLLFYCCWWTLYTCSKYPVKKIFISVHFRLKCFILILNCYTFIIGFQRGFFVIFYQHQPDSHKRTHLTKALSTSLLSLCSNHIGVLGPVAPPRLSSRSTPELTLSNFG